MPEDINVRIIKKITKSKYDQNVKDFLIFLIREEFQNSEYHHWNYTETYDKKIKEYSSE